MPSECRGCQWQNVVWCSVRDRLVSIGITPPCVVPIGDGLAEAKAEIERLRKNAALGELVRGMRRGTRLTKGDAFYWAEAQDKGLSWHRKFLQSPDSSISSLTSDSAEALRSIQEVGDAEV